MKKATRILLLMLMTLSCIALMSTTGWSSKKIVKKCDSFLILVDESSSMHLAGDETSKIKEAKALLKKINELIPKADYKGSLVGYNHNEDVEDVLGYKIYVPLSRYSKEAFSQAIKQIGATICFSSLAYGIDVASTILAGTSGRTHLIILSDGVDTIEYPKSTKEAVSNLKNAVKGNLCVFVIQFGDSDQGKENLSSAVEGAECGKIFSSSDVMNNANLFVKEVFGYVMVTKTTESAKDTDKDGVPDKLDKCPNTPKGAKVNAEGCWHIGMIHFDFNSYKVKPVYYPILEEIAQVLKENPDLKIEIIGYTDAIGSDSYNIKLSLKRALEVKKWICERGIICERIKVKAMGEKNPISDNSTPEGRAKNRRVEFRIIREGI